MTVTVRAGVANDAYVAVDGVDRLKIDNAGNLIVIAGGLTFQDPTKGVTPVPNGEAWTQIALSGITGGTGSLSDASGFLRYKKVGRTVHFSVNITIVNNGSAGAGIRFPVPWASAANQMIFGREVNLTGNMLQGSYTGTQSNIIVFTYANSHPGANGNVLVLSGTVEVTA